MIYKCPYYLWQSMRNLLYSTCKSKQCSWNLSLTIIKFPKYKRKVSSGYGFRSHSFYYYLPVIYKEEGGWTLSYEILES